jgi:hypothetical protein
MAYGQADDARRMNADLHKLDRALSVAREALQKIADLNCDLEELEAAQILALRAEVLIAKTLSL